MRRIGAHLVEGMRRTLLTAAAAPVASDSGVGIVVLAADLSVQSINAAAESWLPRIRDEDWPRAHALPLIVQGGGDRPDPP